MKHNFKDHRGKRFGHLTALSYEYISKRCYWRCFCSCGRTCIIRTDVLLKYPNVHCGCLTRQHVAEGAKKHGLYKSPEYRAWMRMKERCNNPRNASYTYYGGRGITYCERWKSVENFLADVGQRPSSQHSLERINVNDNYGPENCRWATAKEQAHNRRDSLYVTWQGKTQVIADWAAELNIKFDTLRGRFRHGWSVEKAFHTPVQQRKLSTR